MANFSTEVIQLAQETQRKYGVPASVTLAQYALESGYGSSGLATTANNYFGITGSYNGNSVVRNGRYWRKYDSMEQSFDDHGRLLSQGRYAEATKGTNNAGEYIDAIAEIYAPSSDGNNNYAGKLKSIIASNNLTQYDTNTGGNNNSIGLITPTGWVKNKAQTVLGSVISIVTMAGLVILAIVFFMGAFNVSLPTKKNLVKKVVESE